MEDALGSVAGPVDVTDVTAPTLLEMPLLGLTLAAYTDGFGHYLAHDELREIAAMTRDSLPRLVPRRAGGWQVETTPPGRGARPVVLTRAVIGGELHFLTGDGWPWPVTAPVTPVWVRADKRRR
jgi:hypothetical protein